MTRVRFGDHVWVRDEQLFDAFGLTILTDATIRECARHSSPVLSSGRGDDAQFADL